MHNQSSLPLGTPTSNPGRVQQGLLQVEIQLSSQKVFHSAEYPMINGSDCTFTFRYYLRCPLLDGTATLYLTFPQNTTFTVITRPAFLAKVLLGLLWSCQQNEDILKNYGTFMCFESIFPGLLS